MRLRPVVATIEDVLAADRGLVVAPAGCGKTQLIVDTLRTAVEKSFLVLTHTNAGVAALRDRLAKAGVPGARYRVATIDGWVRRMLWLYPLRADYEVDPLGRPNYPAMREAAFRLCRSTAVDDVLTASYGRVLVDEYQDCSVRQHALVCELSQKVATIVLGDPMQAVFGFGDDELPDWSGDVGAWFPLLGELDRPWRWENACARDLGDWILSVRRTLLAGNRIDLRTGGARVQWRRLTGNVAQDIRAQITAQHEIERESNETILIVGDARNVGSRHQYARNARGVSVVEPVELRDVVTAAGHMNGRIGEALLEATLDFAKNVMVNLYGDRLRARAASIRRKTNRTPPTAQEAAAVSLAEGGGYREASALLRSLAEDRSRRIFRRSAFTAMVEALETATARTDGDLTTAAIAIREQRRHAGRRIPFRAVGSTLLLKGLEADHVLILDADPMTATHLFVALSRGAKSVTVFSSTPVVP